MAEAGESSSLAAGYRGGYDTGVAIVRASDGPLSSTELSSLTCASCGLLLRDPQQVTTCGHRFCRVCIDQIMIRSKSKEDAPFVCPLDGIHFQRKEVRKDKYCLKEISRMEVECPIQPDLCSWKSTLPDMEVHHKELYDETSTAPDVHGSLWTDCNSAHVKVCPHKVLPCSHGCGQQFKQKDLEQHQLTDCPVRPIACEYCGKSVSCNNLNTHYQSCKMLPISCDFCHKSISARKELQSHLQECTEYCMDCPHIKCQFKGKKSVMNKHIMESHLFEVLVESCAVREEVRSVKSENQKLKSELSDVTARMDELVVHNDSYAKEISRLKEQLSSTEGELDRTSIQRRLSPDLIELDSAAKVSPRTHPPGGKPRQTHAPTVNQPPSVSGDKTVVKVEDEMCRVQLQKLNENILAVQNSLAQYVTAMEELRLRQDVLDVKTVNGIFIWKIPNIRRRYRDAIDGTTLSLYSPPFYTSPHGYRVCVRTYLNGDGIGKGTHISVFFFIMRSEHDNLLSWPFKQSVRFTLINQKNPVLSTTEAFVPDQKSPSFQKPQYDMNIASGFPKFARQSVLQDEDYTVDNVIYIKCQVDLSGLTLE